MSKLYHTMALRYKMFVAVVLLTLASCNTSPTQSKRHKATLLTRLPTSDTIVFDKTIFPIDTLLNVKLLMTGNFHGDEVWSTADKEKWFGLFKSKDDYYISETSVITKRVFDPVLDDDTQKTGWEVSTTNSDDAYLLIEALPYLSRRKVEKVCLTQTIIYPGDTTIFAYNGINYKLFATGGKKKEKDNPIVFEVWNYKLFIIAHKGGHEVTQLLASEPNFDDNMIDIIFAGDIDGDGFLDMIIDLSTHYNTSSPTLYLSKPAPAGQIVKPLGMHSSSGC